MVLPRAIGHGFPLAVHRWLRSNPSAASPALCAAQCPRGRLATAFPMLNDAAGGPGRWLHRPLFVGLSAPAGDWPWVSLRCSPMVTVQPVGCITLTHQRSRLRGGHGLPMIAGWSWAESQSMYSVERPSSNPEVSVSMSSLYIISTKARSAGVCSSRMRRIVCHTLNRSHSV